MNYKILKQGVAISLLFALIFAGCKKDSTNNTGGNNPGGTQGTAVAISGFKFSPAAITIPSGTTVTWTNNDSAPHTVTADDNSFTSGTLNQGAKFSHKFTSAATVNYHCEVHPMMTASVTVQ
jgi:plastocyanin